MAAVAEGGGTRNVAASAVGWLIVVIVGWIVLRSLIGTIGWLMYRYGYFGKVAPRRGRGRMAIPKLKHPKRGERIASFSVPT